MAKNYAGLGSSAKLGVVLEQTTSGLPLMLAEDIRGGGVANYTTAERDALDGRIVDNNMIIYVTDAPLGEASGHYQVYTGGTRNSDGVLEDGSWDTLRVPSTDTTTRLTDLDDTRIIESSGSEDWIRDTAAITTPPYLDRDLEHNLVTRFRIRNTGPTIEVDDVNTEQHSWRGYQITANLTTAFAVFTITDSEYDSSLDSSLVTVSGRDLFDESVDPLTGTIWQSGFKPFVYVGTIPHTAQNDVLIYDAGLRQWVNSQKLAREIADRKNADELITTQLGSLYRELELVTYTYSDATSASTDSAGQTRALEDIFKKVTDQSGELGTNQFIWPAYIERQSGAQEFHIFFNNLTALEIDTIENHYLAEGLGRIALATNTLGYAGVTQSTSYVSTGLVVQDRDDNVENVNVDPVEVLQVIFDGDVTGTAADKIALGDVIAFSASPGPTQLYEITSAFYDGSASETKVTFFRLEDGQLVASPTVAIYGETIFKQVIAEVDGLYNFQIAEFGTQTGSVHFMKLVPDSSWDPSHATALKALAQATTVYLGHTSYSFNPSIETKRDGVTGGPTGRDGVFSNPRLIVSQHSFGGTAVEVAGEALDQSAQGFVNQITIDGTANRVFQPKPFILTQGFVLLTETPDFDTGTRAAYTDQLAVFGPIGTVYHFDSADDSWYQGSIKIVGF